VVVPADLIDEPPRRLTLEKLLALAEPDQRLARLAELREGQAEEATAWGRARTMLPVRYSAIPCSISERAFAQSPF
jgi:hypothetical protein